MMMMMKMTALCCRWWAVWMATCSSTIRCWCFRVWSRRGSTWRKFCRSWRSCSKVTEYTPAVIWVFLFLTVCVHWADAVWSPVCVAPPPQALTCPASTAPAPSAGWRSDSTCRWRRSSCSCWWSSWWTDPCAPSPPNSTTPSSTSPTGSCDRADADVRPAASCLMETRLSQSRRWIQWICLHLTRRQICFESEDQLMVDLLCCIHRQLGKKSVAAGSIWLWTWCWTKPCLLFCWSTGPDSEPAHGSADLWHHSSSMNLFLFDQKHSR